MKAIAQAPTISSFSPSSGPVGTLITITGTNLSNPNAFTVGGVAALIVSNTGTQLIGFVMPGALTGPVSIANANGVIAGSGNFTVTSTPYPTAQQGGKLVGTGYIGTNVQQGIAVAVSADGNTAIVGGNINQATWVFTRTAGIWTQQGTKLVGTGGSINSFQGGSVACSADGNTIIVGALGDNSYQGAAWIFVRTGSTWTQQGNKLTGTGNIGAASQGFPVAMSADGNTAIIGGFNDNGGIGAAWVFTRTAGTWTQQGSKLIGTGNVGAANMGRSVALSADGNTAVIGGRTDNNNMGAVWVFTRSGGTWTQQGNKITPTGNSGNPQFGWSAALSADGNTMLIGAENDSGQIGALWIFTRNNNIWSQQGNKLVGTGYTGTAYQGSAVALSADGNTAVITGYGDNLGIGGMWTFTRTGSNWIQRGGKFVGTGNSGIVFEGQSVSLSADGSTALLGGYADNGGIGATWVFTSAIIPPVINVTIPTGSITTCAGTASANPAIQQFTVSGSNLINDIVVAAPPGFQISFYANTGFGTGGVITPANGVVNNTIVYVRASAAAPPGNITGYVTLTSGTASQNVAVSGSVNALVTVNAVSNQTVFNGAATAAINFTGTGSTFAWTNDTPGIGLASSGTGNIASFIAVNNGTSPIKATITVTPLSSGFAYIANFGDGTESVINTSTNTVVATIPVGTNPFSTAVTPDGSRAYVVNANSYNVSVINTQTNAIIATIPVGITPDNIVISPDGSTAYVTNGGSASVSVINTATNTVVRNIAINVNPYGIAISPDGGHLYVTYGGGGSVVSVIDTKTNVVTASITVGQYVFGVAVTPDGSRVYVTSNTNGNNVLAINTITNSIIATMATSGAPYGIAISPDGSRVYVASNNTGVISVIGTATNTVISTIPLSPFNGSYGVSFSPDGSRLYVTNEVAGTVSVLDPATNTLTATIKVGKLPDSFSNFVTESSGCPGVPVTFNITVNSVQTIIASGPVTSVSTTYGTPSSSTSFNVSGANMSAGILVTPPPGFEVSTDNITFSNTVTVGSAGLIGATPVYIRLSSASAVGSYTGNIVLSSSGATSVNLVMPNSTVSPAPLTLQANAVNKVYGVALVNNTNSIAFSITAGSLQNGNTITSVSISYGAGSGANSPVGVYTTATPAITAGAGGFLNGNYNITYTDGDINVTPAPLTIIASDVMKTYGNALTSGSTSTAFTSTGLQNQENIGSVTISYGPGSLATDPAGVYTGAITPSAATGGTFTASNYTITYQAGNLTVQPQVAIISAGALTGLNTIYGTPSSSTSFTLSGSNLPAGVLVAPPSGFEVSTDNVNFYLTLTIGSAGNISNTPVYIRLKATSAVGNYSGDILLTSGNILNNSEVMPSSNVSATPLIITADNKTKVVGMANPALTASYSGFVNSETVAQLTTQPTLNTVANQQSPVGQYAITVAAAAAVNYTFVYVAGILTIDPLPPSITIPNTFTPNGDGINDVWNIANLAYYSNNVVNVYNRYGQQVYQSTGYAKAWDGTHNGVALPTGTYYYIIVPGDKMQTLSGKVTIVR